MTWAYIIPGCGQPRLVSGQSTGSAADTCNVSGATPRAWATCANHAAENSPPDSTGDAGDGSGSGESPVSGSPGSGKGESVTVGSSGPGKGERGAPPVTGSADNGESPEVGAQATNPKTNHPNHHLRCTIYLLPLKIETS
jgi:hypothetical protein